MNGHYNDLPFHCVDEKERELYLKDWFESIQPSEQCGQCGGIITEKVFNCNTHKVVTLEDIEGLAKRLIVKTLMDIERTR